MREDHPDAVKVVVRMSDGSNSQQSADIQTGEPIHRFSFPYVSAAHVPICPRRDKHGTVRCGAAGAAPHNRVTGIDLGYGYAKCRAGMDAIVMCRLTVGKISNGSVNSAAASAFLTGRPCTLTRHNEMSDSPACVATDTEPAIPVTTNRSNRAHSWPCTIASTHSGHPAGRPGTRLLTLRS